MSLNVVGSVMHWYGEQYIKVSWHILDYLYKHVFLYM